MPIFKIHVSRTATRHAVLSIESDDPTLACKHAYHLLDNHLVEFGEEKDSETHIVGVTWDNRDYPVEGAKDPMPESLRQQREAMLAICTSNDTDDQERAMAAATLDEIDAMIVDPIHCNAK